jgi:anti-sigma factor RsiW
MTTCRDSLHLLLEYAEGHLPDEVRARLEAHFGGCQPCEDFLKTYRATPGLCKKALAATMPEAVSRRLMSFLRHETQASDCSDTPGEDER